MTEYRKGNNDMTELNEQLATLRQQLSRRKNILQRLASLEQRKIELTRKMSTLASAKNKEQADVERLEKGGIASFFYSVTGKKEQKLEKERQEAAAAEKEYNTVRSEYDALVENIAHYTADLENLTARRAELDELLSRKTEALRAAGADVSEIDRIGAMLGRYEKQLVETDEALVPSEEAHATAKALVETLSSAVDGAVYDLQTAHRRGGEGKYECLDVAAGLLSELNVQLKKVRSELVGVDVSCDLNVEIGAFLRFFDDNRTDSILADKLVLDKIRAMHNDALSVREKLDAVVNRLREKQDELTTDIDDIRSDYESLIIEA